MTIKTLIDPGLPTSEAYSPNIRNGIIEMSVRDNDISEDDLGSLISQARAIARWEYFKDKRGKLTPAECAQIDLYAFSQLYLSAESSYQGAIRLAEYVLESGEYLNYEPASGMSPEMAWQLWVDDAVIEIGFQGKLSDASLRSIRSDIKHKYPALVTPLMQQSINLSVDVTRKDKDTIIIDGSAVNRDDVSKEITALIDNMADGQSGTFKKTIGPDYIANHPNLIREIGPIARNINADGSGRGRADFEQLIEAAVTRTRKGLREYMRTSDIQGPEYPQDAGTVFMSEILDRKTGEIKTHYRLTIETDSPANLEWYKTQVSARCEFGIPITITPEEAKLAVRA